MPLDDDDNSSHDPLTTFQTPQTAFFQTVDRIDKQLTRQIFALEEAGIVTLRGSGGNSGAANAGEMLQQQQGQQGQQQQIETAGGEGGGAKAVVAAGTGRLEPDGTGKYGKLDVGRLNMASSKVEREMEGEMWRRGREHLEGVVRDGEEKMEE
jgi:hypothetical protein